VQFSAIGETTVHTYGFTYAPNAGSASPQNSVVAKETLDSLLRVAPSEIERWSKGTDQEHDVTVYSFNPAIRDELLQTLEDAGYVQAGSGEHTRDWDLERGVLQWCVSPDTAKWAHVVRFSAMGETTVHTYDFTYAPNAGSASPQNSVVAKETLDSLLRVAPAEIQRWSAGSENERDVTVYSFNPAIRDELLQAVEDAGYFHRRNSENTRDWSLDRGVLRWCVPNAARWDHEVQFSAMGEKTVHTYRFRLMPNADGVPKTVIIMGYRLEDGITAEYIQLFTESSAIGQSEVSVPAEIDGQTITSRLEGRSGNRAPWTGQFYIVFECRPPKDPSKDGSKYVYSADGINPTPVDIKDAVTTLEWAKFIWLLDYTAG
jgi:hypothetical protein